MHRSTDDPRPRVSARQLKQMHPKLAAHWFDRVWKGEVVLEELAGCRGALSPQPGAETGPYDFFCTMGLEQEAPQEES